MSYVAGPYASLHLAPDRQPRQHPTTEFLPAECPSCRPTNSVKALKVLDSEQLSLVDCSDWTNIARLNDDQWRWSLHRAQFGHVTPTFAQQRQLNSAARWLLQWLVQSMSECTAACHLGLSAPPHNISAQLSLLLCWALHKTPASMHQRRRRLFFSFLGQRTISPPLTCHHLSSSPLPSHFSHFRSRPPKYS